MSSSSGSVHVQTRESRCRDERMKAGLMGAAGGVALTVAAHMIGKRFGYMGYPNWTQMSKGLIAAAYVGAPAYYMQKKAYDECVRRTPIITASSSTLQPTNIVPGPKH